jgi:hypothetical protein
MAEIRSTMDMVMERAAKMAARTPDAGQDETFFHAGMRAGASFLRGEEISLETASQEVPPEGRLPFKKGLVNTFMRHLVLPRQKEQISEGALRGLLEMGNSLPASANLAELLAEMRSILSRYVEHRQQLKTQLEEQFSSQMAMLEQNLAQKTGVSMKMSPAQHPRFAEEWQKLLTSLNDQYDNALSQYKDAISQQLLAPQA